ncbi:MAG: hypothetical protein R3B06_17675 [Kofleriaceae bacterium]
MVTQPSGRSAARLAAWVLACASAGGHLAGAAADGWFLAAVGPDHLGGAVALSSLVVALVLAAVGSAADRHDRRRTLVGLGAGGAALLAVVSLGHALAPGPAAVVGFLAVKQIQAAVELAFWVAISEWFDARTVRRLVPRFAAAGGLGGVLGAALVAPIADAAGASTVMLCGAGAFAVAALLAGLVPAAHRLGPSLTAPRRVRWLDGLGALRRQPIARGLAAVVAIAGVAASLTYVTLGAAAAARYRDAADLAGFLGSIRVLGQVAMIAVQLLLAPRLLARLGVGGALAVAPAVAAVAAVGLVVEGGLGLAAALQIQARCTDGAVEGPAEKLALNLVPAELRGRLGGWLEGPAKRTGAIIGGLVAGAVGTAALGPTVLGVALVWLAVALWVRNRLPTWALGALVRADDDPAPVALGERAARRLVTAVAATDPARAADLAARLYQAERPDARRLLVGLYLDAAPARPAVIAALARTITAGQRDLATAQALATAPADEAPADAPARLAVVGRLGRGGGLALEDRAGPAPVQVATAIARARLADDRAATAAAIAAAVDDDDPAVADVGVRALVTEVADRAALGDVADTAAGRQLVRVVRRRDDLDEAVRADAIVALVALAAAAGDDAEARWLRADAGLLVRAIAAQVPPAGATVAAALRGLARWPGGPTVEDLATLTDALGARDDLARAAAAAALREHGPGAVVALVRTAALGRRGARDRAVALLGELAVTPATLDDVVATELDTLDELAVQAGALAALGDAMLDRRLDERLAEVGHTALLLVAVQAGARDIARAARAVRSATTLGERARAVEILDATLPRAVAARVVPILDPGALPARVHGARVRRGPRTLDEAIAAAVTGPDPLTRDLLVRALPPDQRRAHRGALAAAAAGAALAVSPLDLLRRVTDGDDDDDVPPAVDVLVALAEVPVLAGLTTPQLAALAERGDLVAVAAGAPVVADGELIDALVVVIDGQLRRGADRLARGQAIDPLAAFAPRPSAPVVAVEPTRLFRLRRVDLHELIDDEPGLGSALVRYLGEALRAAAGAAS